MKNLSNIFSVVAIIFLFIGFLGAFIKLFIFLINSFMMCLLIGVILLVLSFILKSFDK